MLIQGGFLDKSAGYYYFVQNIKLFKTGWTHVSLKLDNKIVITYKNENKEMLFKMKDDNNYNILLMIDGAVVKQTRQLFKYELEVTLTDNSYENVYEYTESMIVDH